MLLRHTANPTKNYLAIHFRGFFERIDGIQTYGRTKSRYSIDGILDSDWKPIGFSSLSEWQE